MIQKIVSISLVSSLLSACFTIQSKSDLNLHEIGDVSASGGGTTGSKEFGGISTIKTGFLFIPCSKLCTSAVEELLDDSKDKGGNALIDLTFEGKRNEKLKTPTCLTRWSLIDLLVVPIFSPWKKKCRVEAIAVSKSK